MTILNFFRPISPEKLIQDQLYEARRAALEHEAAAEHHEALAMMFRSRVDRLESIRNSAVGTAK